MRYGITIVLILLGSVAAGLLLSTSSSCRRGAEACVLCERPIHENMKAVVQQNGKKLNACCPACALTQVRQVPQDRVLSVTDYVSGDSIAAEEAVYVAGSNVKPCTAHTETIVEPHSVAHACFDRCEPSLIAFRNRADAVSFQSRHGGKLVYAQELPERHDVKGGIHHD